MPIGRDFNRADSPPAWSLDNPYIDLLRDRFFVPSETMDWAQLPARVRRLFLTVERRYVPESRAVAAANHLFALVHDGAFLPNSPVMMNGGNGDEAAVNLFACHVLAPPANADALRVAATIHDGCGGIGYDLSASEDPVGTTWRIEKETEARNPGRKRKAHSAVTLMVDHPQLDAFIALGDLLSITHTNVELNSFFFERLEANDAAASGIWHRLCQSIAATGKPAVVFSEHKARRSPNGEQLIPNVCGESLLRENESSLIGSLNLTRFTQTGAFDRNRFVAAIELGVRCLDGFHDLQLHASPDIAKRCAQSRKIGLGIMGYSDALLLLGLRYGSEEALDFGRTVMALVSHHARLASENLAEERSSCDLDLLPTGTLTARRNASLMAVAANGTLSLLANVTGGIEPIFSYLLRQNVGGVVVYQLQPTLRHLLRKAKFGEPELAEVVNALVAGADVRSLAFIPEKLRATLVCAHDLSTTEHIDTQAMFQSYIDGGISKTINLPSGTSAGEVGEAILRARASGCVGLSLYCDGSVRGQPTQSGARSRMS
jgi:ribonucleoside-diphosphate reductase alpha chain